LDKKAAGELAEKITEREGWETRPHLCRSVIVAGVPETVRAAQTGGVRSPPPIKDKRARMMKITAQILAAVSAVPANPKKPKALATRAMMRNRMAQRNMVNPLFAGACADGESSLIRDDRGFHVSPKPMRVVFAFFMPMITEQ
jgi:hypothetical protein